MKLICDSSAFSKRYVLEAGSEDLDNLLQRSTQLALCTIVVPEIISGLNRRRSEQVLSTDDYRAIKRNLIEDVHDAIVLQITSSVISHSVSLLENNGLRAMDALHIACALEWRADLFATADRRQLHAVQNAGLPTEYIGQQAA